MPNFKKNWPCSNDCKCTLCLELHDIKQGTSALGYFNPRLSDKQRSNNNNSSSNNVGLLKAPKKLKGAPPDEPINDNFILRKSLYDFKQMSLMELSNIKKAQSYQEISKKLELNGQRQLLDKKISNSSNNFVDHDTNNNPNSKNDHRTVIYFGDSIKRPTNDEKLQQISKQENDYHARRLCEELNFKREKSIRRSRNFTILRPAPATPIATPKTPDFIQQLKTVLQEKTKTTMFDIPLGSSNNNNNTISTTPHNFTAQIKVEGVAENIQIPEPVFSNNKLVPKQSTDDISDVQKMKESSALPSYIESIVNGVISIRIEDNFQVASRIVNLVNERETVENGDVIVLSEEDADDDPFDWSFVQEWRSRPQTAHNELQVYKVENNGVISPGKQQIAVSNPVACRQVQSPLLASSAIKKESSTKELNNCTLSPQKLNPESILKDGQVVITNGAGYTQQAKSEGVPGGHPGKVLAKKPVIGPTRITVQSQPVKTVPAMASSSLNSNPSQKKEGDEENKKKKETVSPNENGLPTPSPASSPQVKSAPITRTHLHNGALEYQRLQRVQECHSSSDENRSSGRASMSDTGNGSSSPGCAPGRGQAPPIANVSHQEDRLGGSSGVTNRSTRSRASNNHGRQRGHRGVMPGANGKVPWAGGGLEDVKVAIQQLTLRSQTSTSTYSSLSAGSESSEPVRRLGRYSSVETINTNVTSADEFVWVDSHNRLVELQHAPWSQNCVMRVLKTGRCKTHMERISAEAIPRLSYLLQRALVRIAREIQRLSTELGLCAKHEVASAFKIVLSPALSDSCIKACLRAAAMFQVSGDGAIRQSKSARAGLQFPIGRFHRWMVDSRLGRFVHEYAAVYLTAGLENLLEEIIFQCLPIDSSVSLTATALEYSIANSGDLWGLLQPYAHLNAGRIASGALTMPRWASQSSIGSGSINYSNGEKGTSLEPCLLTTCVGSLVELKELVVKAQDRNHLVPLSYGALSALFYFMRCSQLEHIEGGLTSNLGGGGSGSNSGVQELCYERAYVVLPPLVEWLRVAIAHAEHRHALLVDKNDIMQAARLLLPGVDCPPRSIVSDEDLPSKRGQNWINPRQGSLSSISSLESINIEDSSECGKRATLALAFKLMLSGRSELLIQALSILPTTTRYDTLNHQGLTALMVAAIRNDEAALVTLLEAGADPNIEVPSSNAQAYPGIHPETQHWTAITFAACRGNFAAVRILLDHAALVEGGARLSEEIHTITPLQATSGSPNLDIVALLLAHGGHAFFSTQQKDPLCFAGSAQRGSYSAIAVAAAHGQRAVLRKLLSQPLAPSNRDILSLEEMLAEGDASRQNEQPTLSKTQIKCLQEAMFHSAENNHLDITMELRNLGVPWTLHCWMHALAAAHELRLDPVIDQLLHDFLQVCPEEYSQQFTGECLPLLFNIFRYSKKEATTLLLADIFSTCYGSETIKPIKNPIASASIGSRIDPKFVNNPELSDVTFRVEGRVFYGHKIVLVTASPRLQNMLSSKMNDGTVTPTVQINDIRYQIFEIVMQYLYSGGCSNLEVASGDILELMAAASFFQLEGLLRYTELRCAGILDMDNVVTIYIHAKVYSATHLMEYCQGFLLQNMVNLLSYNDSVKRLLFAKKIPNHDVLNGLLATLQERLTLKKNIPLNQGGNQVLSRVKK